MKYKLLGKTGIRVSEMCLGGMTFGTDWGSMGTDFDETKKIFDTFLSRGGNFIDTANIYTKGTSEKFLAELIQEERQNLVLASKFSLSESGKINQAGNHRKNMIQSIDLSLKNLKTDYIDLYYVHAWDFTVKPEELMRNLEYLVSSGKVLSIGVSDTPAYIVSRCNTLAELRGWSSFAAYQIEYSLTEHTADREIVPCAELFDMSICSFSPLAAGLLSGKYLDKESKETRRMKFGSSLRLSETNLVISEQVANLAKEYDCTPAQLSLNWVRQQNEAIITIYGARNNQQNIENLDCISKKIPVEAVEKLNELSKISLGFPHDFLETNRVKEILYANHYDKINFK